MRLLEIRPDRPVPVIWENAAQPSKITQAIESWTPPVFWEKTVQSSLKILQAFEQSKPYQAFQRWTPYTIRELSGNRVRVAPFFTTEVRDFTQKEFTLFSKVGCVDVREIEFNRFKIAETGVLEVFDNACTFTSYDGLVLTASIPPGRTDVICTGLAILGASISTAGIGH